MNPQTKIKVSEIFGPTIQGEGALIGLPTVFVRTGGCDYRCSWCDTMHAVDSTFRVNWTPMDTQSIWDRVLELSDSVPLMVSLSGGNPAIQPLKPLIDMGKAQGYRFALETQGSIAQEWFNDLDALTLSPKPPSSGMDADMEALHRCVELAGQGADVSLKFVVFDDVDYDFAKDIAANFPDLPVYLQPGNHTPPAGDDENGAIDLKGINERMLWLVDKVNDDQWFTARVLPQLHVMLWGNQRGV